MSRMRKDVLMVLDWKEAIEKYSHYWVQEKGGFWCPIAKQIVQQCYTDHHRGGLDDGGFRIVTINACHLCGDPDFRVGRNLRALNEKRKKEAEQ